MYKDLCTDDFKMFLCCLPAHWRDIRRRTHCQLMHRSKSRSRSKFSIADWGGSELQLAMPGICITPKISYSARGPVLQADDGCHECLSYWDLGDKGKTGRFIHSKKFWILLVFWKTSVYFKKPHWYFTWNFGIRQRMRSFTWKFILLLENLIFN